MYELCTSGSVKIDLPEDQKKAKQKIFGLFSTDLGVLGVTLDVDSLHRWFVTIETGDDDEIAASGMIRRVARSAEVERVEAGARETWASGYAENGLWYDALDLLNEAIAGVPDPAGLRVRRAAFLERGGLELAVEHDRSGFEAR